MSKSVIQKIHDEWMRKIAEKNKPKEFTIPNGHTALFENVKIVPMEFEDKPTAPSKFVEFVSEKPKLDVFGIILETEQVSNPYSMTEPYTSTVSIAVPFGVGAKGPLLKIPVPIGFLEKAHCGKKVKLTLEIQ